MKKDRSAFRAFSLATILVLISTGSIMTNVARTDEFSRFHVYRVPYVRQNDTYWCGPASLTMILSYWGVNVTQQEIAADTYDPQAKVTDISAMKSCPQEYGFRSEELSGSIGVIREGIRKGCPVIVLQKVSPENKYGHYRVVIGYDDEKEQLTTHDPIFGSNYNITYVEFAELWKPGATFQTCNWTLLVIPENSLLTSQAEKKQLYLNQKASSTQQPLNPTKDT